MFRQFDGRNSGFFGYPAAFIRQLADQPVGFRGIVEPWLGPPLGNAAADRACVNALSGVIEERKFSTGLGQAPAEPGKLACRGSRRTGPSIVGCQFLFRCRHSQITLRQITLRMAALFMVS